MLWNDATTAKQRIHRAEYKREAILSFLRQHTYSDLNTLSELFGFVSNAGTSRLLSKLVAEGLIKKAVLKEEHFKKTLFGITREGLGEFIHNKIFYPSNVNIKNWKHTMYCQRAAIFFLNDERTMTHHVKVLNIETGDIQKYGFKHRPDLLLKPKNLNYICVEVELNLKAKARYKNILLEYCELMKKKKIGKVMYVFYDQRKSEIFTTILSDFFMPRLSAYGDLKTNFSIKVFK